MKDLTKKDWHEFVAKHGIKSDKELMIEVGSLYAILCSAMIEQESTNSMDANFYTGDQAINVKVTLENKQ